MVLRFKYRGDVGPQPLSGFRDESGKEVKIFPLLLDNGEQEYQICDSAENKQAYEKWYSNFTMIDGKIVSLETESEPLKPLKRGRPRKEG